MSALPIVRLGTVKQVERFQEHVRSLGLTIPCDRELLTGMNSPLRAPLNRGGVRIGNRITVQPMEGSVIGSGLRLVFFLIAAFCRLARVAVILGKRDGC